MDADQVLAFRLARSGLAARTPGGPAAAAAPPLSDFARDAALVALAARAEEKLGVAMGETTLDRRVTLEPVYCLGLCHSSPAAMLDKHVFGMLDEAKLDQLVKEAQA